MTHSDVIQFPYWFSSVVKGPERTGHWASGIQMVAVVFNKSFIKTTSFVLIVGKEADDNRLMTEADDATLSVTVNSPGKPTL